MHENPDVSFIMNIYCMIFFCDQIFYWFSRYAHAKGKMYCTYTKVLSQKLKKKRIDI